MKEEKAELFAAIMQRAANKDIASLCEEFIRAYKDNTLNYVVRDFKRTIIAEFRQDKHPEIEMYQGELGVRFEESKRWFSLGVYTLSVT